MMVAMYHVADRRFLTRNICKETIQISVNFLNKYTLCGRMMSKIQVFMWTAQTYSTRQAFLYYSPYS